MEFNYSRNLLPWIWAFLLPIFITVWYTALELEIKFPEMYGLPKVRFNSFEYFNLYSILIHSFVISFYNNNFSCIFIYQLQEHQSLDQVWVVLESSMHPGLGPHQEDLAWCKHHPSLLAGSWRPASAKNSMTWVNSNEWMTECALRHINTSGCVKPQTVNNETFLFENYWDRIWLMMDSDNELSGFLLSLSTLHGIL